MQDAPWQYNLISLAGILAILALSRLCGLRRGPVKWAPVAWGLGLMAGVACLVFLLPAGRQALLWLNGAVVTLLGYSRAGIMFLFGPLGIGPGQTGPGGEPSLGFILAIQYLPTIIFFMALSALLYQAGILQRVVSLFARVFARLLGTSGAESLGAASTIFVGIETAGMIRPYLKDFTRSEFFCLLTALMSTVASSTLGVYVGVLSGVFPNIAGHLMSASLLSAPAAIVVAKLMEPETGEPLTFGHRVDPAMGRQQGYMEAVMTGSMEGLKLVAGVTALLMSFLGLAAVAGGLVSWLAGLAGFEQVTLDGLLSYLAWPLSLAMGVPPADAGQVAGLLGQRVLVTEIPSYVELGEMLKAGQFTYWRSPLVASYALCGFAHIGSVAIFTGGLAALVPERLSDLSRLGLKALWAATLATALTGSVAGVFAAGGAGLLGIAP